MRRPLEGPAGTGKTHLLSEVVRSFKERKITVRGMAPTHKACDVLKGKLKAAGIEIEVDTVHKTLSLEPDKGEPGEGLTFHRKRGSSPPAEQAIICDEASMLGTDLMRHARLQLGTKFVLCVGDRAQLPPVNEGESEAFAIKSRSVLTQIVRQAEGNPIIAASAKIRALQKAGSMDWSWCAAANNRPFGIYTPARSRIDAWLQKAFTSEAVRADPDAFRYLAWTNAAVATMNARIRQWKYGDLAKLGPFQPGERALARNPIGNGDTLIVSTNQEFTVSAIKPSEFRFDLEKSPAIDGWTAIVPSWRIEAKMDDGMEHVLHMVRDGHAYTAARERIISEAYIDRERWRERRSFDDSLARLQPISAMTVHTSQGSTFGTVFVDVPDIRRRVNDNLLEALQLYYVALTRASTTAVLTGVA